MQFGSGDFKKVYADFGSYATFQLNPAVRSPTGSCVDEDNCDYERITLCAFNSTSAQDTKVNFLICMDESKAGSALEAAEPCASSNRLDFNSMKLCYDGNMGQVLLMQASNVFNHYFPNPVGVPNVMVDGVESSANYRTIKKDLCAGGSSAPVCSSDTSADPEMCIV